MKLTDKYWELISSTYLERAVSPAAELFLPVVGARTGTMRLREAITLLPQHEYGVVWGKLPALSPVLLGSTVMVEPTSACSTPKNILVGRVVTLMLGDCWIPALHWNAKIANVFPCLATEDSLFGLSKMQCGCLCLTLCLVIWQP
ncbi:hypothetical protein N1851_009227 [Merluccius polli]|uniref:Uncharacterized protein n=1 Tax=Merluccius polli TaxID=89951 RepID=A0AA47N093_MERPO|nr:hypothetical protein N1851_009227 [Merluccius polli]